MRRKQQLLTGLVLTTIVGTTLLVGRQFPAQADAANAPSLTISQLKITSSNGQFVTLYNATDTILDMSHYQLEYFNHYDVSKSTSSRLIGLTGKVPPHSYYMVSDDSLALCYKMTISATSLGFSSTAGMVAVLGLDQHTIGGPVTPTVQDYVAWTKTAATGAQTLPTNVNASLLRQPTDSLNNPTVPTAGVGSWLVVQPDSMNPCRLVTASGGILGTPLANGANQLLTSGEPPASIVMNAEDGETVMAPVMPAADIGLMAPKVNELLPNPVGTGNDNTDEFIELYNPNDKNFDLSGFTLQTGITSTHDFVFPKGTLLPAKSFTAFRSEDTKLSLSNTASQARLLDPFGNSISTSDQFKTAKEGNAWALAKGKWYYTTNATPGSANIINLPAPKKSKTKTSKKKSSGTVKNLKSDKSAAASNGGYVDDDTPSVPIHTWTLVIVATAALLYGAYEYRTDLANRIGKCRAYVQNRGSHR